MKKLRCILFLLGVFWGLSGCGSQEHKEFVNVEETEYMVDEMSDEQKDWITQLKITEYTNQILVVAADGTTAEVSLHTKNENGIWEEVVYTSANIGKNGIGKTQEGDGKTPTGIYHFTFGFGIKENPGLSYEYIQVDDSHYWVDDSNSQYYNQFVSTNEVLKDWSSAEHIIAEGESYHYVLATDYNSDCVPGVGSAIFMHCNPTGGAGCIALSEESMIEIMQQILPECVIVIDDKSNIFYY